MRHFSQIIRFFVILSLLFICSCGSKKDNSSTSGQTETVANTETLKLTGIERFRAYLNKTIDFMKTDEYTSMRKDKKKEHEKAIQFAQEVGYTGTDKEITKQILEDTKYVSKDKSIEQLFIQTIRVTKK